MNQRRKFIGRFFLIAAVVGLLVFLGGSRFTSPWRSRIGDALSPVLAMARQGSEPVRGWLLGASGKKLRAREEERAGLLARIAELESERRENETLRQALAMRQAGEEGVIPAKALAFFREGRDEFLLLSRGTSDGIGIGDIVIDKNKVLAGTVVEVGPKTSRVILLSSPSRSIDVIIPSANLRALSRGNNLRELIIELVPQDSDMKAGDLVTASSRATGGRADFLVGEIREVEQGGSDVFKTVRAVHLFDPAEEDVLVLLAP